MVKGSDPLEYWLLGGQVRYSLAVDISTVLS